MDFKVLEAEHEGRVFRIEEDYAEVGAYLLVYEDGMCVKDFLQDSIDICQSEALEDYGVPLDKWTSACAASGFLDR